MLRTKQQVSSLTSIVAKLIITKRIHYMRAEQFFSYHFFPFVALWQDRIPETMNKMSL